MTRIALVGCGRSKGPAAVAARDLYTSTLFRSAVAYAESRFLNVRILSAKHGAIRPETVIAPYDECLDSYDAEELAEWGHSVMVHQLAAQFDTAKPLELVVFAGQRYAKPLRDHLVDFPMWSVSEPLHGLTLFRRMQWFAEMRRAA